MTDKKDLTPREESLQLLARLFELHQGDGPVNFHLRLVSGLIKAKD